MATDPIRGSSRRKGKGGDFVDPYDHIDEIKVKREICAKQSWRGERANAGLPIDACSSFDIQEYG